MSNPTGLIISNSTDANQIGDNVDAQNWHKMNLVNLWDQHTILNKRLIIAQQLRKEGMIKSIAMGIEVLNEIINKKAAESDNSNFI